MSSKPHCSGTAWSDLPICLQAHVLSFLSNQQLHTPMKLSLSAAETLGEPLPLDLLPVARASPGMASATAEVLGQQAAFLTRTVAKEQLSNWIKALGPHVKGVSTVDSTPISPAPKKLRAYLRKKLFDRSGSKTRELLRVLSAPVFSLQVLDLRDVPFDELRWKRCLRQGLVSVLEQSSSSMKELALPVTKVCAKALKKVSLKSLAVLELDLGLESDEFFALMYPRRRKSAKALLRMLISFEHGRNCLSGSDLRELRLKHLDKPPCQDVANSGCSTVFFRDIETLHVKSVPFSRARNDLFAKFVTLFPNLKNLHWTGVIEEEHLHMISRGCSNLQKLDLKLFNSFNKRLWPQRIVVPTSSTLESMLKVNPGKVKSLVFANFLTSDQMKAIGVFCPQLESLSVKIGRANTLGLRLLLERYCRKIRKLEITVMGIKESRRATIPHWPSLLSAVRKSSDDLHEVALFGLSTVERIEFRIELISQFMMGLVVFLGDRARNIRMFLHLTKPVYRNLVEALCCVLRACSTHATQIERLDTRICAVNPDPDWKSEEEDRAGHILLSQERQKLLRKAECLQNCHVLIRERKD